jgi:hypothetical protein
VTTVREADTQVEVARFVLFSAEILRAFEKV